MTADELAGEPNPDAPLHVPHSHTYRLIPPRSHASVWESFRSTVVSATPTKTTRLGGILTHSAEDEAKGTRFGNLRDHTALLMDMTTFGAYKIFYAHACAHEISK